MTKDHPFVLFTFLPFYLFTFLLPYPTQDGSSLAWGTPIRFEDFKAEPNEKDTAAASISVTILLGYSSTRQGDLKFSVSAVMDKEESWIKEEYRRNEEILNHEQGHFDIAHIYARRLGASLKGQRFTRKDVVKLHAIYDAYLADMHTVQTQYDKETQGGINRDAQKKWKKFIDGQLKEVP